MNNVVRLGESVKLYSAKKDLTSDKYKQYLSSITSMDASTHQDLREQNDSLIKFLEGIHFTHDKYRSELLQLKEKVSDLSLDLEDERIETKQLREKLFSISEKNVADKISQISHSAWENVTEELPKKSGIYLLTDGIQQCVGYFNSDHGEFAKTTYFSMPTHWMSRPDLP